MGTMLTINSLAILLYFLIQDDTEKITFLNIMAPGFNNEPSNDCFFVSILSVTAGFVLYVFLQRKLIWLSIKYSIQSDDISNYSLIFYNASPDMEEADIIQNF